MVSCLVSRLFEDTADRADRLSLGERVILCKDVSRRIHQNHVCADRAHIYAKERLFFSGQSCFIKPVYCLRRINRRVKPVQAGQLRVCGPCFKRGLDPADHLRSLNRIFPAPVFGLQRSANRPHDQEMFGYNQLSGRKIQQILKCPYNTRVSGHTSLKHNGAHKRFALAEITDEISRQCVAKTCYHVFFRNTLLLEVNHVALCKHTATARNRRRFLGFQRKPAECLLDIDPESRCLLVQKRAGACRAHIIQGMVRDQNLTCLLILFQKNQL